MATMSARARSLCQSPPWRLLSSRVILPWALQGDDLTGDVLEIGCGSGAMAASILGRHPDARVTVTDLDLAMIDAARVRLRPFGARATVAPADAVALPFRSDSFDAVVSFVMLHHVIAWEDALAEVARILRPGGALLGYDVAGDGAGIVINGREHGTRRMTIDELGQQLDGLGFAPTHLRSSFGGRAVRFQAARPA